VLVDLRGPHPVEPRPPRQARDRHPDIGGVVEQDGGGVGVLADLLPNAATAPSRVRVAKLMATWQLSRIRVGIASPVAAESTASPASGAEPREVTHVTLSRDIRTANTKGTFLIDFVNREHLTTFVATKVLPFAEGVADRVSKDPIAFRKRDMPPDLGSPLFR
jgi:hypothetical protein